ncbi:hypothetical protein [Streptomyces sp. NPDC005181]|uniref:hypothetical protein n=1 Tax=Streptomyces sp. NPDC005181 TaxID=3156869 RepID=UPI0033BBCC40
MAGEGSVGGLVVGDAEGERAADGRRLLSTAARDNVAVLGGAGCGARPAADADPDADLVAGGEPGDAGGLDGTGSGDVHGDTDTIGGEDGDGARVDDGGLDALCAGVRLRYAGPHRRWRG